MIFNESPQVSRYAPLIEGSNLVISFQTVGEMRLGSRLRKWEARRHRVLEKFLLDFNLAGYSDELATHWTEIMLDARRVGRRLESGDAWIAATARMLKAPLLTHDRDLDATACPSFTVHCFS